MTLPDLLARADEQLALAGADDAADIHGIACAHFRLPYPWATQARALSAPPTPVALTAALAWLRSRSAAWTVMTREPGHPVFTGLTPWLTLPALVLRSLAPAADPPGFTVGPAVDGAEFLSVYGTELAPLLRVGAPDDEYLVGRYAGEPVACARVRWAAGTAYVSGVTVVPEQRGHGFGAAISTAATRRGADRARVVWLHAADRARPLYERLGYVHVEDHVLMVPATDGTSDGDAQA